VSCGFLPHPEILVL